MSYFGKLWSKSCENYAVSKDVAAHWHRLIQTKYSTEPNRFQHNFHLLEKKCQFLFDLRETITFADYIVFTLAFQYYHFDSNALCCEMNCSAFREFYGEAGINDVSKLFLSIYYANLPGYVRIVNVTFVCMLILSICSTSYYIRY